MQVDRCLEAVLLFPFNKHLFLIIKYKKMLTRIVPNIILK